MKMNTIQQLRNTEPEIGQLRIGVLDGDPTLDGCRKGNDIRLSATLITFC